MVSVRDGVAAKRRRFDLDVTDTDVSRERIDPITPSIDEPSKRLFLRRPAVVTWNLFALVGELDPIAEVQKGQVHKRRKAEHFSEAPPSVSVVTDLTIREDQALEGNLHRPGHAFLSYIADLRLIDRFNEVKKSAALQKFSVNDRRFFALVRGGA